MRAAGLTDPLLMSWSRPPCCFHLFAVDRRLPRRQEPPCTSWFAGRLVGLGLHKAGSSPAACLGPRLRRGGSNHFAYGRLRPALGLVFPCTKTTASFGPGETVPGMQI